MNAVITNTLDMLERIERFMLEHVVPLPRAAAARAAVLATITALRAAAKSQTGGRNQSTGGAQLREACWRALREVLRAINRTARTLEAEHPGIRPTFRLPRTRSFPALTTSAKAIIAAATPIADSFVAAGLPETFLSEVTTVLDAFEAATAQKHGGKIAQVAATAALKAEAARGIDAATKLDACVRNHFRHQPEIVAAWTHARHVQRGRSRPRPTSPPPPARTAQAQTTPPPPADQPPSPISEIDPSALPHLNEPQDIEPRCEILPQLGAETLESPDEFAPHDGPHDIASATGPAPQHRTEPDSHLKITTPAATADPGEFIREELPAAAPAPSIPPRRTSVASRPEQISLFPSLFPTGPDEQSAHPEEQERG